MKLSPLNGVLVSQVVFGLGGIFGDLAADELLVDAHDGGFAEEAGRLAMRATLRLESGCRMDMNRCLRPIIRRVYASSKPCFTIRS